MAKIFLVGLGGSGSRIVVNVENLIKRLPEETQKDITVATLGIDTHDEYLSNIGNPISKLQINTNVKGLIENIKQFPHIEEFWNTNVKAKDTANGAGGVRILSKVSVYRQADKIVRKIEDNVHKLSSTTKKGKIYVFVVGSLFGGTGSGAFIDIANIISNELEESGGNNFRIIGHFFLPSVLPTRTSRNSENAYASLMEYEHILKEGEYTANYTPQMMKFKTGQVYHNMFLISGFNHDNLTLPRKPEDFYDLVAHKIYYEIISNTLFEQFIGRLIDVHVLADSFHYEGDISKPTAFSSFGMSALLYPYDNIRRYFSNKIAASILEYGFLGGYERENVEKDDVKGFISKNSLDKLDGEIRRNKEVAYDLEQLRFNKSDYDRGDRSFDQMLSDLQDDYNQMKSVKFDRFYKTVKETTRKKMNELKKNFIIRLNSLIKSYGLVRSEIFIDILLQNLYMFEKRYSEEFKKFERISDDSALKLVKRELNDVIIYVSNWWPVFKRRRVMRELDEFIEEANSYVDNNSNEIINEYAALLVADFRGFIQKFYIPGGKHGSAGGFLDRMKLQTASTQRKFESDFREVGTYITEEEGDEHKYRVIHNLKTLDELNAIYNNVELNPSEQFTLFTNKNMPDLELDPDKIANMPDEDLDSQLDIFNIEAMEKKLSEQLLAFSYKSFDDNMFVFRPENIIKLMSEDEIIRRIDDMIEYCSPFLGYKENVGRVEHVDNTIILIRTEAHKKIADRITDKYGGGSFLFPTDDVDFLMIMKYSHGYDLNSLTETNSIAGKYKALRKEDRGKRHIDFRDFDKMEHLLTGDIDVVSKDAFLYFGCGMFFNIGEDFTLTFGAGRGNVEPKFKGRHLIDRSGTGIGINFKFLDWTGKDKFEQEMARTVLEAFEYFKSHEEIINSVKEFEKKFIAHNNMGHKKKLNDAWESIQSYISDLKGSTRSQRDEEMKLFKNMFDVMDEYLADMI